MALAVVFVRVDDEDSEEGRANARLIAAAPDLYEAARAALDLLPNVAEIDDSWCCICDRHAPKNEAGEITGPLPHRESCTYGTLRAAIAKAEGRS